jgi:hypothetical protein
MVFKAKAACASVDENPLVWPSALLPALALPAGPLQPLVRILYTRHRFRAGAARVTLDERISARTAGAGALPGAWGALPFAVLEVKTEDPAFQFKPLRELSLRQSAGSKFAAGLLLLSDRGR